MHSPRIESGSAERPTSGLPEKAPHQPSPGDPRVELLAVLVAIAAIGSEPLGRLHGFFFYLPLVLAYAASSGCGVPAVLRRTAPMVPVLVILALGLPLSRGIDLRLGAPATAPDPFGWAAAASLFLRALSAILLVSALVQSMGFVRVLAALRRLGLPLAVLFTLEHLERYRALIAEEWRRTSLAREARSPGGARFALASYANQTSLVLLRSWDRSERIHHAMLARGFRIGAPPPPSPAKTRPPARSLLRTAWLPVLALSIRLAV